jgi:hypothetical protein
MFLIKCLVEDRHLAAVLRRLAGLADNVMPIPCTNVVRTRHGPKSEGHNNHTELLFAKVKSKRTFTAKELREIGAEIGLPDSSVYNAINKMKNKRLIAATSEKGKYKVLKPPKPDLKLIEHKPETKEGETANG